MTFDPKTLPIAGAGFSWHAGLLLMSEFTPRLLDLYHLEHDGDAYWQTLESFFAECDAAASAVLSMNRDTVIEQGVARAQSIQKVEYHCAARAVRRIGKGLTRRRFDGKTLHIVKPHGPVNRLYCDACREIFWVPPKQTGQVAKTMFPRKDWNAVLGTAQRKPRGVLETRCPHCAGRLLNAKSSVPTSTARQPLPGGRVGT